MTLSFKHRIRNSSPGGLRPITLPLGHGDSPQYWVLRVDGEETPRPGNEPRTLAWKAALLTTTLGPPPALRREGRIPSKHKTFVEHLYNVGPTSKTLGRRCTNVIQMFYVYWVGMSCWVRWRFTCSDNTPSIHVRTREDDRPRPPHSLLSCRTRVQAWLNNNLPQWCANVTRRWAITQLASWACWLVFGGAHSPKQCITSRRALKQKHRRSPLSLYMHGCIHNLTSDPCT